MRKTIWLAVAALAVAVALFWHAATRSVAEQPSPAPAASAPQSRSNTPAHDPNPGTSTANQAAAPTDPLPAALAASAASSAYPIDLEALRARLPDNLYWTLGAPTEDENTLRLRSERARQTNELYGKVLSTAASEEEIKKYYAERRRMSEDYIEFAELVLAEYRHRIPAEQASLYELSIRLHSARLQEIVRDQDEALVRRRAKMQR